MKKFFVMVLAAMMATLSVQAQDGFKNEIGIAYGGGSNTDFIGSLYKGMFSGKQLNYWGPVSVEYFHRLSNDKLGIGGIFAVGGCKWDDSNDAKSTFYTVMPAMKYNWLVRKHVSCYSKIGIGMTIVSETGTGDKKKSDDGKVTVNWQASVVGVEFGGAFRGFVEIGTGEQGIILGGLRYKF